MLVLVLNLGSSSLKAAVFDLEGAEPASVLRTTFRADRHASGHDVEGQVAGVVALLEREGLRERIGAVGHRVVHGGPVFQAPVWLESATIAQLRGLTTLAPDHLPLELRAIESIARALPGVRQAACFDTTFHRTMPARARMLGLPRTLADRGIVRYGFHGLSCEHVVDDLVRRRSLGRRVVIAHLGSGSSVTAVLDGRSVDTSMGFTPAGGVVMSTRSGDLDPGVLLYLIRECGYEEPELNRVVNVTGGLLGVSGRSGDMQALLERAPHDARAAEAVELFCYQIRKAVGAYAAVLEGLDAVVFTGGIGEHAASVRATICSGLAWCGLALDGPRNARHEALISSPASAVAACIVPADEEVVIAGHVNGLIGGTT